jgi:hypothetical protein
LAKGNQQNQGLFFAVIINKLGPSINPGHAKTAGRQWCRGFDELEKHPQHPFNVAQQCVFFSNNYVWVFVF